MTNRRLGCKLPPTHPPSPTALIIRTPSSFSSLFSLSASLLLVWLWRLKLNTKKDEKERSGKAIMKREEWKWTEHTDAAARLEEVLIGWALSTLKDPSGLALNLSYNIKNMVLNDDVCLRINRCVCWFHFIHFIFYVFVRISSALKIRTLSFLKYIFMSWF